MLIALIHFKWFLLSQFLFHLFVKLWIFTVFFFCSRNTRTPVYRLSKENIHLKFTWNCWKIDKSYRQTWMFNLIILKRLLLKHMMDIYIFFRFLAFMFCSHQYEKSTPSTLTLITGKVYMCMRSEHMDINFDFIFFRSNCIPFLKQHFTIFIIEILYLDAKQ